MKRQRILIINFMILVLLLIGCTNRKIDTSKEIDYLMKNNSQIYSYKEEIGIDKINTSFNLLKEIDLSKDYLSIVIDVSKHYDKISKELMDELYLLLNSKRNVMVLFVEADNYDFFIDTLFAKEKGVDSNAYIYGFYNFAVTSGIVQFEYSLTVEDESDKIKYASIIVFYRRVRNHIGAI